MQVGKFLPTFLVLSFLAGCTGQAKPVPTSTLDLPTATTIRLFSSQTASRTHTLTVTPTETRIPRPTIPNAPLRQAGPWFLFSSSEGSYDIYAMNPDGSGLTQIYSVAWEGEVYNIYYISSVSSTGGYLAIIRSNPGTAEFLTIIQLPSGNTIWNSPTARSISLSDWSPDGKQLAFISVTDNNSSDLYLYSLESNEVIRLTNTPSYKLSLSWSPDGKYIVTGEATDFVPSAVVRVVSLWATTLDGQSTRLYSSHFQYSIDQQPIPPLSESILGWVDSHTFMASSQNTLCNNYLRTFNIETYEEVVYWFGCYNNFALDPFNSTLIVTLKAPIPDYPSLETGTYLLIEPSSPVRIDDMVDEMTWSNRAGAYLLQTGEGVYSIKHNGIEVELPFKMSAIPSLSPDKRAWAWTDENGTYVGLPDNGEIISIFTQKSDQIIWQPESSNLILCTNSRIYIANAPDYSPILLNAPSVNCINAQIVWP